MKINFIVEQTNKKKPKLLPPAPWNVAGEALVRQLETVQRKIYNFSLSYIEGTEDTNARGLKRGARQETRGSFWDPQREFNNHHAPPFVPGRKYQNLIPWRLLGGNLKTRMEDFVKCIVDKEGSRKCKNQSPGERVEIFNKGKDILIGEIQERLKKQYVMIVRNQRGVKISWAVGIELSPGENMPWLGQNGQALGSSDIPVAEDIFYFYLISELNRRKGKTDSMEFINILDTQDISGSEPVKFKTPDLNVPIPLYEYWHQIFGAMGNVDPNAQSIGSCGRAVELFKHPDLGSTAEKAAWAAGGAILAAGSRPIWRFAGRSLQHHSRFRIPGYEKAGKVPLRDNLRQLFWDLFWPASSPQVRGLGGVGGNPNITFQDYAKRAYSWGRSPTRLGAYAKGGFGRLLFWGLSNNLEIAMIEDLRAFEEWKSASARPDARIDDPDYEQENIWHDFGGAFFGTGGLAFWSGMCFLTAIWLIRGWGPRSWLLPGAVANIRSRWKHGPLLTTSGRLHINWLVALEAIHGVAFVRAARKYAKKIVPGGKNIDEWLTIQIPAMAEGAAPRLSEDLGRLARAMDDANDVPLNKNGDYMTESTEFLAAARARAATLLPEGASVEVLVGEYIKLLKYLNAIRGAHKGLPEKIKALFNFKEVNQYAINGSLGVIKRQKGYVTAIESLLESGTGLINQARAAGAGAIDLFPNLAGKVKAVARHSPSARRVHGDRIIYTPGRRADQNNTIGGVIKEAHADIAIYSETVANNVAALGVTERQLIKNVKPTVTAAGQLRLSKAMKSEKIAEGVNESLIQLEAQVSNVTRKIGEYKNLIGNQATAALKDKTWQSFLRGAPEEVIIPIPGNPDGLLINATKNSAQLLDDIINTKVLTPLGNIGRGRNILDPTSTKVPTYVLKAADDGKVSLEMMTQYSGALVNPKYPKNPLQSTNDAVRHAAQRVIDSAERLFEIHKSLQFTTGLKIHAPATARRPAPSMPRLDPAQSVKPTLTYEGKKKKVNLSVLYD